jgi:diamine N-acetyltransferase
MRHIVDVTLPNGIMAEFGQADQQDMAAASEYYRQLNDSAQKKFAPHSFELTALQQLYKPLSPHIAFVARVKNESPIIAFVALRIGLMPDELPRLSNYGIYAGQSIDFSYAPSVADQWQGRGLGTLLLNLVKKQLFVLQPIRFLLWGGVQCSNELAINYYLKNGFVVLGEFYHQGNNLDMALTFTG